MSPKKPTESASQAENEALAARLIALRETVEANRLETVKNLADMRGDVARMGERVEHAIAQVDKMREEWKLGSRELKEGLRRGDEQVAKAGELAVKMENRVKVLDELREGAVDPHELIKPLRRELTLLRTDLESLGKNTEVKLAEIRPKQRGVPLETR